MNFSDDTVRNVLAFDPIAKCPQWVQDMVNGTI